MTGCDNSSGFGFKTASELICRGFNVIACCYHADAARSVSCALKSIAQCHGMNEDHIHTLTVDVRSDESVSTCVELAQKYASSCDGKLWALVNNAGVQSGTLVDWTSLRDYEVESRGWVEEAKIDRNHAKPKNFHTICAQVCMEVNFFGVVRMTKKCLPHLKRSGGRVVTITSIDGLRTLPGISAYSASKHAAEVIFV